MRAHPLRGLLRSPAYPCRLRPLGAKTGLPWGDGNRLIGCFAGYQGARSTRAVEPGCPERARWAQPRSPRPNTPWPLGLSRRLRVLRTRTGNGLRRPARALVVAFGLWTVAPSPPVGVGSPADAVTAPPAFLVSKTGCVSRGARPVSSGKRCRHRPSRELLCVIQRVSRITRRLKRLGPESIKTAGRWVVVQFDGGL